MEDTDWDLHAVVRSCTTARASTGSSLAPTAPNSGYHDGLEEPDASWMWNWVKRDQEVEESSSHHHVPLVSRVGAFHDSEELYQPFLFASPTTTTYHTAMTAAASSSYAPSGTIIPNSPTSFISDFGGGSITSSGQHQLQQQQNNFLPANINTAQTNNPHFNPGFPPVSGLRRFPKPQLIKHPKLERPVDQPEELIPRLKPVTSVGPAMQIPRELIRPRKGKTPVKKVVCHLAENNLSSSDLWAWRKYGQKPIKGSPHPRNYYRCSSSKGCSARKQVERSVVDPDMFVVTYCGDHTHPRPTHRNSLAGSTRNKAAAVATIPPPKAKGPESPPVRLMPAHGGDDDDGDNEQAANNISNSGDGDKASEEAEEDEEMEEYDDEDEDEEEFVVSSSDDIFLGMKPLGRSGSGGNTLGTSLGDGASVDDGSSWEAAGCSSSAGATVNGGF